MIGMSEPTHGPDSQDGMVLIAPYLRHGPFFACVPGNKLPGYDLSVPSGQG